MEGTGVEEFSPQAGYHKKEFQSGLFFTSTSTFDRHLSDNQRIKPSFVKIWPPPPCVCLISCILISCKFQSEKFASDLRKTMPKMHQNRHYNQHISCGTYVLLILSAKVGRMSHTFDLAQSYVWFGSVIRLIWFGHTFDLARSYVWPSSTLRKTLS